MIQRSHLLEAKFRRALCTNTNLQPQVIDLLSVEYPLVDGVAFMANLPEHSANAIVFDDRDRTLAVVAFGKLFILQVDGAPF